MALHSIRIHCQRPDCPERTQLPIGRLPIIGARTGIARTRDNSVSSLMVMFDDWAYGTDPDGVLYALCPRDAAASKISPEAME